MQNDPGKRYEILSKMLDALGQDRFDELVSEYAALIIEEEKDRSGAGGEESGVGAQRSDKAFEYSKADFTLRCLRAAETAKLPSAGNRSLSKQLKEDFDKAADEAEIIELSSKKDDKVFSDTLDVICALSPSAEDLINRAVGNRIFGSAVKHKKIDDDTYLLFTSAAGYCLRAGWPDDAYAIMEGICEFSRLRSDEETHCGIVTAAMSFLGEKAMASILRIAEKETSVFAGLDNECAGNFYWWYGNALQFSQKTEEALAAFERCYDIRRKIYGEDDWYTSLAGRNELFLKYAISPDASVLTRLCDFVEAVECGRFPDQDPDAVARIEGETLYIILNARSLAMTDISLYKKYLDIYDDICGRYSDRGDPLIQQRLKYCFRGTFYFYSGDYMYAESAFADALDCPLPDGTAEMISSFQIKSDLLLIYTTEFDSDKSVDLLGSLFESIDNNEEDISRGDILRVLTSAAALDTQQMIELDDDQTEIIKSELLKICRELANGISDLDEPKSESAAFVLAASFLVMNKAAGDNETGLICDTLIFICDNADKFLLDPLQETVLCEMVCDAAAPERGKDAKIYLDRALELIRTNAMPPIISIGVFMDAARYHYQHGDILSGDAMQNEAFENITSVWQSYVSCINDARLVDFLSADQVKFMASYSLYGSDREAAFLYDKVLRFKQLASLAGRERNRILLGKGADDPLLHRIRELQDRLSEIGAADVFGGAAEGYEEVQNELRRLENDFTAGFHTKADFTKIDWERVREAIPDNSAVIEYFFCVDPDGKPGSVPDDEASLCLDIFVACKTDGKCTLDRIRSADGGLILDETDEFVSILSEQSEGPVDFEKALRLGTLRTDLFRLLIKPAVCHISRSQTIYVAPDYDLVDLPFSLLYDENDSARGNGREMIMIGCARDFLFVSDGHFNDRGLVIGDPEFSIPDDDIGRQEEDPGDGKRGGFDLASLSSLPFSGMEADRIATRCGWHSYKGAEADKSLLLSAGQYGYVHIATHGYIDMSEENDSLFSSCLIFAGAGNWRKTGRISEKYGNGIVSAEEISRMDLHGVELFVLSSCFVGMSDIVIDMAFCGMIGALGAAGVKYVIADLWRSDDLSTAVLMDSLYRYIHDEGLAPPEALTRAKEYLRTVSVGELRGLGWLKGGTSEPGKKISDAGTDRYSGFDDKMRPFRSESYWGGFVCSRCN